MDKASNISKTIKLLMIILAACFLLTACNGTETDGSNQGQGEAQTPLGASGEDAGTLAKNQRQCWQSGILELLYKQMGLISFGMYEQITDGALALMMVAFAIWFSFRLMRHVSSMQEENMAEIWNEVLRQLFLCFVCGILASSSEGMVFVLNTIVFPLYYTFLEFAGEMLNAATTNTTAGVASFPFLGEMITYGEPVRCTPGALADNKDLLNFPTAPLEMMKCMACSVNERLSPGFALSFKTLWDTGIMALLVGMFIFLIFTFIKLSFIFYLVDTLFKFTVMVAILPILIMSYAFKQTRSWATNGFKAMINSAAFMMFIAIMIAVSLLAMEEIMRSPELGLTSDNMEEVKYSFKEFSIPLLCLMLLAFLMTSTMKIAQQLTDSLVGGSSDSNFQKRGAKAVAMLFKWVTFGMSEKILKMAKDSKNNIKK